MSKNIESNKKLRKIEKWTEIIDQLQIDISKPTAEITAKEIKQISGEEPRLMAKMDEINDLPMIFKTNNLFLLPISRSRYIIIKGKGYHTLNYIDGNPILFNTNIPFPKSVKDIENENVFLEYANSCGLLQHLTSNDKLIQTFRGRTTTPSFVFKVSGINVKVDGAQIEIDSLYESYGKSKEILIFEAKIGIPTSFSIRQLYYAFRTFKKTKKVRVFFFCYNPLDNMYRFWEFHFKPFDAFESIQLVQSRKYRIKVTKVLLKDYSNVIQNNVINIPQADDVNKIMEFPIRVAEGYDNSKKMIDIFEFVLRQSSYYRHAAEILGLIETKNYRYELTSKGKEFVNLTSNQRAIYTCKLLLEFPIIDLLHN